MPRLKFVSLVEGVQTIELEEPILTIGSDNDNAVCIEATNISQHHVLLARHENTYKLFDLYTSNGTLVNGQRITVATLKEGDAVKIGDLELVYSLVADVVVAKKSSPAPAAHIAPARPKLARDSAPSITPAQPTAPVRPKLAPDSLPAFVPSKSAGDTKQTEPSEGGDNLGRTQVISSDEIFQKLSLQKKNTSAQPPVTPVKADRPPTPTVQPAAPTPPAPTPTPAPVRPKLVADSKPSPVPIKPTAPTPAAAPVRPKLAPDSLPAFVPSKSAGDTKQTEPSEGGDNLGRTQVISSDEIFQKLSLQKKNTSAQQPVTPVKADRPPTPTVQPAAPTPPAPTPTLAPARPKLVVDSKPSPVPTKPTAPTPVRPNIAPDSLPAFVPPKSAGDTKQAEPSEGGDNLGRTQVISFDEVRKTLPHLKNTGIQKPVTPKTETEPAAATTPAPAPGWKKPPMPQSAVPKKLGTPLPKPASTKSSLFGGLFRSKDK